MFEENEINSVQSSSIQKFLRPILPKETSLFSQGIIIIFNLTSACITTFTVSQAEV